jgi:hypothetical protein
MYRVILIMFGCILFSCKKDNTVFSEARYRVTVTGLWSTPSFGVPAGAHLTTFVGAVHNSNVSLWKEGSLASNGIEQVAENGNGTILLDEINTHIAHGKAAALLLFLPPTPTGTVSTNIYLNSSFSQVSFASMLAPTPDWFTGISSVDLLENGTWVPEKMIDIYSYDAGTEEGDVFSTNNPDTSPKQPIRKITPSISSVMANGNTILGPIATITFVKL